MSFLTYTDSLVLYPLLLLNSNSSNLNYYMSMVMYAQLHAFYLCKILIV